MQVEGHGGVPYREAVGEPHEQILLRRRQWGELRVSELRDVARQEAGPERVGVGRGVEGFADSGGAAGGHRPGSSERRQHGSLAISQLAGAPGAATVVSMDQFFLPLWVDFGWGERSGQWWPRGICIEWITQNYWRRIYSWN